MPAAERYSAFAVGVVGSEHAASVARTATTVAAVVGAVLTFAAESWPAIVGWDAPEAALSLDAAATVG